MNEQQKRDEIFKLLTMVYFEWDKPITDELVTFWLDQLRGFSRPFCWKVAKELSRKKTFGPPRFQDFYAVANQMLGIPADVIGVEFISEADGERRRVISNEEQRLLDYVRQK